MSWYVTMAHHEYCKVMIKVYPALLVDDCIVSDFSPNDKLKSKGCSKLSIGFLQLLKALSKDKYLEDGKMGKFL